MTILRFLLSPADFLSNSASNQTEVFPNMMDRRTAIKHLGGAASALLLTETLGAEGVLPSQAAAQITPSPATQPAAPPSGPYTLPPLPYAYDALEPSFDAAT